MGIQVSSVRRRARVQRAYVGAVIDRHDSPRVPAHVNRSPTGLHSNRHVKVIPGVLSRIQNAPLAGQGFRLTRGPCTCRKLGVRRCIPPVVVFHHRYERART